MGDKWKLGKEVVMTTISKGGFLSFFRWPTNTPNKSKKVNEIAMRAYKATNGPTEELRNVYRAYLENKAKSTKRKPD